MPRITKKLIDQYLDFIGYGPMCYGDLCKFVEGNGGGDPIDFARDIAFHLRSHDSKMVPHAMYLTIYMLANGFHKDRHVVGLVGDLFRLTAKREGVHAADVFLHDEMTGDRLMSVQDNFDKHATQT